MTDYDKAFTEGAKYVLEYLRDEVYGKEIEETNVWSYFVGESEKVYD